MRNPLARPDAAAPAPKAPPAPDVLLDRLRNAQERHRQDIEIANAQLVSTHSEVLDHVIDRQAAIEEQVQLLKAEQDGLAQVARVAAGDVGI